MATDTAKLVDQLGKMTVLELVELKNQLEEEWGVTAAAPVAVAAPGAAPAAGAAATATGAAAVTPHSSSSEFFSSTSSSTVIFPSDSTSFAVSVAI